MDIEYFNEIVFEKLKENKAGIVLELSNGNQKHFTNEDVKGCSIDNHSIFCIDNWAFDISSSIGIKFNDPLSELLGL